MTMRVGAQMFTLREFTKTTTDAAAAVQKIADIGYTCMQVSAFGSDIPGEDIARMASDAGVDIVATHVGWKDCLEDIDEVIRIHKLWSCSHVAIGMIPIETYFKGLDGVKLFLDELAPVAEKLAAEGMDFSYHNHNWEFAKYDGVVWLEELYSKSDPALLKAELDTYWIQAGGGDPIQWIEICAGRQPLLHVKDMIITKERETRMAEIGEGNLNWSGILEAAAECGVEYVLVEQDKCYERDPFESLAMSYRFLVSQGLA